MTMKEAIKDIGRVSLEREEPNMQRFTILIENQQRLHREDSKALEDQLEKGNGKSKTKINAKVT